MATIENIVLDVTNGLSGKFVPYPTKGMVLRELVVTLNRFRESLRWKVFFDENPVLQDENAETINRVNGVNGLGTGLKPSGPTRCAPRTSSSLELLLKELTKEMFYHVMKTAGITMTVEFSSSQRAARLARSYD